MDFKTLKQNRQASFDALAKKLQAPQGQSQNNRDDRYWSLKPDAAGNASAIIRFLPQGPDGEPGAAPYVQVFDHAFKYEPTGKWYIEKDLTTLGQDDPCQQLYQSTWKAGDKDLARLFKKRGRFHANILVVKDPNNPENEGKVFLFRFGAKILEMIQEVMSESDDPLDDTSKFNPFCMWEGANFRIRQQKVDGWPNYSKSKFEEPAAVGTDEQIEAIWRTAHSLSFLTDPSQFKSYAELQSRLNNVLGIESEEVASQPAAKASIDVTQTRTPAARPAPAAAEEDDDDLPFTPTSKVASTSDEDDDDDLDGWLAEQIAKG